MAHRDDPQLLDAEFPIKADPQRKTPLAPKIFLGLMATGLVLLAFVF